MTDKPTLVAAATHTTDPTSKHADKSAAPHGPVEPWHSLRTERDALACKVANLETEAGARVDAAVARRELHREVDSLGPPNMNAVSSFIAVLREDSDVAEWVAGYAEVRKATRATLLTLLRESMSRLGYLLTQGDAPDETCLPAGKAASGEKDDVATATRPEGSE